LMAMLAGNLNEGKYGAKECILATRKGKERKQGILAI
jgi:hypothetical protein